MCIYVYMDICMYVYTCIYIHIIIENIRNDTIGYNIIARMQILIILQ